MKNKKKILALVLAAVITISPAAGTSISAMAGETEITAETVAESPVEMAGSQTEAEAQEPENETVFDTGIEEITDNLVEVVQEAEPEEEFLDEPLETVVGEKVNSDSYSILRWGTCGNDLTWEVTKDSESAGYTLTIRGTGKMTKSPVNDSELERNITRLDMGNGVTTICSAAFSGYYKLTDVILPESLTSIADNAFKSCTSLKNISIPKSVKEIGDYAFQYCSVLPKVVIPEGVTSIGECAFEYCSGLKSVSIPNSVKKIGKYAFRYCSGLPEVMISQEVTSIEDGAFMGCTGLTSILIPTGVTEIKFGTFWGCTGLKSVSIPKSMKKIESYAFKDTALEKIQYDGTIEDWSLVDASYDGTIEDGALVHVVDDNNDPLINCMKKMSTATPTATPTPTPKPTMKLNVSGTLLLKTGQKMTALKVSGFAAGDYVKSWKSSNTKIVKVSGKSDGTCTITAQKKTGTAKIVITLASGLKKSIKVKVVKKAAIKTTKLSGLPSKITLAKGKKQTLSPVVTPISSTQKVTYTSSDKKVAAVTSKGVITAKKKGTATITVKSGSKSKKIKVTVK